MLSSNYATRFYEILGRPTADSFIAILAKKENYQFKASPDGGEDLVEDPVCHTYVPMSQAVKKEISGIFYVEKS